MVVSGCSLLGAGCDSFWFSLAVARWSLLWTKCDSFWLWSAVARWHPWLTFCDNSALSGVVAALLWPRNLLNLAVALAAFASRSALSLSNNDIAPFICPTAGDPASPASQFATKPQGRPRPARLRGRPAREGQPAPDVSGQQARKHSGVTAGESSTREHQRGEPSLAAFRGVVFQGEAITGKSWRRGLRLRQLKSISSLPCGGTDDATGRLTLSLASRPVMAGRLAADSAADMTARGCERSGELQAGGDFLVTVWAGQPGGKFCLNDTIYSEQVIS